jgi:bzd-type benzoyl-CoA reductase N subunit
MTKTGRKDGMAAVLKHYAEYGARARQLKGQGKKVIGYLTALMPVEVMTAAGVIPLRMKGNPKEAITKADGHMETIVCPFVRSVFDSALRGKYDFLDGIVLPHQCDSIEKTNDVWRYNLDLPYWYFLNVPHLADGPSLKFMGKILEEFSKSLEAFTGNAITGEALAHAVSAHNENRRLMRDLYRLRQTSPPLVSGVEMMKILVAAMSLPVKESSELIESVTEEAKERKRPLNDGKPRIMLVGDQIDDTTLVEAIEYAGAWVVMDDLSIGSKVYWNDVGVTPDPIKGIAERYLKKLKLPTTFIDARNNYEENLETRFGHLKGYAEDFNVSGVIVLTYKNCDPYGFEVPALKSYLTSLGMSVLHLEDEYHVSAFARLKTRIEAFLEMIL